MNVLRMLVVAAAAFALTAGARAEDKKDNAKLLVGTWEFTKSYDKGPPVGSVIEFTKDGKIKLTHKADGKESTHEGTYKLDGDKIALVVKDGDNERKINTKIKKISETELVTENDAGKTVEMKRKK